jgi:hypothetical protein
MKYELTDIKNEQGLYRIRALKDFNDVKAGDLGGWVASEANLSQDGNAWIYDDSMVFDNARVSGNAKVFDNARISGESKIYGSMKICGHTEINKPRVNNKKPGLAPKAKSFTMFKDFI